MKQVKGVLISTKSTDTERIAKAFLAKLLKNRDSGGALVVGLSGELGAGKTAFVQAAGRHLGVKNKIASPTFVIMKKYELKNKKHKYLFHLDAYRLKSEKELLHLGWEEVIGNREHLVFIEWPENVKKIMPPSSNFIHISHGPKGERHFELLGYN